jgi:DNA-binding response OmpR family regulator
MKILIIEDNHQIVRDISFCLQVRYPEVTVVSVAEWQKGIEMVETESRVFVIVD